MTVQTSTNVASFNGDGANKVFPIGYKFNSAADLVVTLIDDEAKTTQILTLNSDFTVTGAGDEEGGVVTLVVAPTAAQRLKATRVVDILQLTDLRNQGKFYAEIHEDVFDLLIMIDQQQQTEIDDANAKSDEAVATANEANAKSDQAVAKADQNLVDMQAQYEAFEQGAALYVLGDYAAGLVISAYNQIFRKDGEFYRAAASLDLPYALTGSWATESVNFVSVGDDVLRQELAAPAGSFMVGGSTVAVASVADLQSVPRGLGLRASVAAYYAGGSHGGGDFEWVSTLTDSPDQGMIFQVAGVEVGRWRRILSDGIVHTDHYGTVKDGVTIDAPAILAAKAYAEAKGLPCVLDVGDHAMGGIGLSFDLPIIFRGASRSRTRLLFSSALTGDAISIATNAYLEQIEVGGFQCVGSLSGTGLNMGKDLAVNAVDCVVSDIKFFEFAVGHRTQFIWDCSFRNLRFQNCTKPFEYGSQTNTCTFESCQYVSFSQLGTFINCEGLLFLSPDISNFKNTAGLQLNQSVVRLVNPYIENPGAVLAQVGGDNDELPSSLHIEGGMSNPCHITYAKNAEVVVDGVRIQAAAGKITIGSTGGSPGNAPQRIRLSTYGNDATRRNEVTTLFYADNSSIVGFSDAYNGGSLAFELRREYVRVTQGSANNGMYLANTLVAGKQYTLVAAVRREAGIQVTAVAQGHSGALVGLDSIPDQASDFRRVHFVFTAAGAELRWIFQGSLQIKLLALYEGVVENATDLPVVRTWRNGSSPTAGAWSRGDIVENNNPIAGQVSGWACTTGGSPGVWKARSILEV